MAMTLTFRLSLSCIVAFLLSGSTALAQARAAAAAGADLTDISRTLEALSERVAPAVVQVFAVGYLPGENEGEDRTLLAQQRSSGSGVILAADGYIVTNAHVVQGATRVQVLMPTRRREGHRSVLRPRPRLMGAQVVAIDDETDLAVLKVAEQDLPFLPMADSELVRPGQLVLAFGSPLGLDSSVTLGVVSAVARQLEPDDPMIYIQTDASINPGNSGGPLVDTDGRLIGINTLILSQSGGNEGLGFAAPSNIVRAVFDQVTRQGRVRRGEIGVRAQTITPTLAAGLGLSRDWGTILADVFPDGPAARAGLAGGDIVLTLDGKPMENGRQFQVNLYGRAVGETVRLQIQRGTQAAEVAVTIVERQGDPGRFEPFVKADEHLLPSIGVLGLTVTPGLAELLPHLREPSGVIVAAAAPQGKPSWEGDLQAGDVIHGVNRTAITDLGSLRAAIAAVKTGDALVLRIEREGVLMFVAGRVE